MRACVRVSVCLCLCVRECVRACVRACVRVCVVSVIGVIVKRPVLPPCAVDGRSRNPLYYWFLMAVWTFGVGAVLQRSLWPFGHLV